jgi:hypothetical protein
MYNCFNNSNDIVNLELSDRLKEKNIIKEFYFHIPTKHINISLNHKYSQINAIFKSDIDDWSKNPEKIKKILNPKGVDKKDIQLLCITVDNHWKKILDAINNHHTAVSVSDLSDLSDQSINSLSKENNKNTYNKEEQSDNQQQESQQQKNIQILSVLEAIRSSEGLKKVIGIIVSRSTNFRVILKSEWKCQNFECKNRGILNFHPPIRYIPKRLDTSIGTNPSCHVCGTFGSLDVIHEYQNAKIIQIEDIDTIDEKFDRLDVIIYGDASNKIIDGEIVEIEGNLITQKITSGSHSNNGSKMVNVLHSDKPIIYKHRKEIKLTQKDRDERIN